MDGVTAYDDDIYAWSQEQAAILRDLASRVPGLPNGLDLENVAEEIEDVGRSELRTVGSFLELLLLHLVKLAAAPNARPIRHWSAEVGLRQAALVEDYRKSMRSTVKIDRYWTAALKRADAALDEHGDELLPGLPETCPFSLDDLLAEPFDIEAAVARLRSAGAG